MSVNFKNLLPSAMRNVRWGQLAQAYQSIWDDLLEQKINPILNQLDLDQATTAEIKLIFQKFGFSLSSYEGFTSTTNYYKREALTLAIRIMYKTARNSYLYTLFIYNLLGDIYPLYLNETDGLLPITDWWENNEFSTVIDELDIGDENILYYSGGIPVYDTPQSSGFSNTTLDADDLLTLDTLSNVNSITRYLLLSFRYSFIENELEFLSDYTVKALVSDVNQVKKATETVFFEPNLFLFSNVEESVRVTNYFDYDQTISGSQKSILIDTNYLSGCDIIQFGTGSISEINSYISGVQTLSYSFPFSQFINSTPDGATYTSYRKKFTYPQKLTKFSEIALMQSGQCLFYSTFPEVNFPDTMNSNIQLSFQESSGIDHIFEFFTEDFTSYTTLETLFDNTGKFDGLTLFDPITNNYNGYYVALGIGGTTPVLPTDTGLNFELIRKTADIGLQGDGTRTFSIFLSSYEHNFVNYNEIGLFTQDERLILKKNITIQMESFYSLVQFKITSNFI